jgi:hypothetical protein
VFHLKVFRSGCSDLVGSKLRGSFLADSTTQSALYHGGYMIV